MYVAYKCDDCFKGLDLMVKLDLRTNFDVNNAGEKVVTDMSR